MQRAGGDKESLMKQLTSLREQVTSQQHESLSCQAWGVELTEAIAVAALGA